MDSEKIWIALTDIALFLRTLAPAVVGVMLGSFVFNRFFIRRANMAGCIDSICKKANDLSAECALYWPTDYSSNKSTELRTLEAKIKGAILQINDECRFLHDEYKINNSRIPGMIMELGDLCTGGQFESKRRQSDIGRYLKIVNCLGLICSSIKAYKL